MEAEPQLRYYYYNAGNDKIFTIWTTKTHIYVYQNQKSTLFFPRKTYMQFPECVVMTAKEAYALMTRNDWKKRKIRYVTNSTLPKFLKPCIACYMLTITPYEERL